jgi:hypothetical protein
LRPTWPRLFKKELRGFHFDVMVGVFDECHGGVTPAIIGKS